MATHIWFSASVLQNPRQCFPQSFVISLEEIAHFALQPNSPNYVICRTWRSNKSSIHWPWVHTSHVTISPKFEFSFCAFTICVAGIYINGSSYKLDPPNPKLIIQTFGNSDMLGTVFYTSVVFAKLSFELHPARCLLEGNLEKKLLLWSYRIAGVHALVSQGAACCRALWGVMLWCCRQQLKC